jgi:hypothetical protein
MLSIKVGKFERKKKKDRMSFSVLIFVVPKKSVKIIDCGIVGIEKKYELTEAQAASDEDL